MNNNTASNTSPPRPKMRGGITGKGWMPGQSGNPRGTLKGTREGRRIMREIKRLTHDGRDLVARLVAIGNGQMVRLGGLDGQSPPAIVPTMANQTVVVLEVEGRSTPVLIPSIRDQREALVWLLERYGGKPKQEIEAVGPGDRPPFLILLRQGRPGSVDPLAPPSEQEEAAGPAPTLALPPAPPPPAPPPRPGRNGPLAATPREVGQVWDGGEGSPAP